MPISMSGLDLSFMRANPLPKRKPKKRTSLAHLRSDLPTPHFVSDIAPFVSIATRDPVEITSRSQLRAYERANNIRQCGELKGKIIPEQKKRMAEATYVSEADKKASDFKWVE